MALHSSQIRDPEAIRQYIENGGDIEAYVWNNMSVLGGCVMVGNKEGVRQLLAAGANPNAPTTVSRLRSRYYYELLNFEFGDTSALLRILLWSTDRPSAIFQSIGRGRGGPVMLKLLLKHGADIQQKCWGLTALHYACIIGDDENLMLLLDAGANIDEPCSDYQLRPLHLAILFHEAHCVIILLDEGASVHAVDSSGRTALHVAARNSRLHDVRQLLQFGPRVDAEDARGDQPLQTAAREGILPVFVLLDKWKQHLRLVDSEGVIGYNYLERICKQMRPHVSIVELLLSHGAEVDHRSHDGCNALHLVCSIDYKPLMDESPKPEDPCNRLRLSLIDSVERQVELLLRFGADVNAVDREGRTPLRLALANPANHFLAEQLLENRADPNIADSALWTCLDYAIEEGDVATVTLLLEHGAKVFERPSLLVHRGLLPLERVIYEPRLDKMRTRIVEAILDHDLDSGWRSGFLDCWTRIDWTLTAYMPHVMRYLVLAESPDTLESWCSAENMGHELEMLTEEKRRMQEDLLQGGVTVFDFLAKRTVKLTQIVRNDDIVDALIERIGKAEYLRYDSLLNRRLLKARKWIVVVDGAEQALAHICDYRLPQLVLWQIIEYLPDRDLLCLKRLHLQIPTNDHH